MTDPTRRSSKMVLRPSRLPTMTSLRVLLAVAERGSTTTAAKSLNLSQSAVSKQLVGLETLLGGRLFDRSPRGMVITQLGRTYVEHGRIAIQAMDDASLLSARQESNPHTLRLQVLPVFGDRWLLRKLQDFVSRYPSIDIQFTTFNDDNRSDPADGIVRFGVPPFPFDNASYLFGRHVVLVGSPNYAKSFNLHCTIEDISRGCIIEHPQTPLLWSRFVSYMGRADLQPRKKTLFGYYTMVLRAALSGQGMAFAPKKLVENELRSGQLVNIGSFGYLSDHAYWFCTPHGLQSGPDLEVFRCWLVEVSSDCLESPL